MPTGTAERTLVVASATVRGAFARAGGLGLIGAALVFPLLVGALDAAAFPGTDLLAVSEQLYSTLFLPVVLLIVCLVLGVGLFRRELEEDTLLYPMNRGLPRAGIVLGKFLGFLATATVVLVPSALLATALAATAGSSAVSLSPALSEALVLTTFLAILSYGAAFLLLGLLTRQAVVIGLLYGFVWETFVSLIPGPVRELTFIYYLRGVSARLVSDGPLAAGPAGVTLVGGLTGLVLSAAVAVALAVLYLTYAEARPGAAPA